MWPKRNFQDLVLWGDVEALKLSLDPSQLISAGWVLTDLKSAVLGFPGSTA